MPKNNGFLRFRKSWHSEPKLVSSLVLGVIAVAVGIGTWVIPEVHAYDTNAFVMVVKTDNPGSSNSSSFTIPMTGTGYNYSVDCNDDGVNEVTARTTSYTCTYGAAGSYTVAITGTFPRIYFNNTGDRRKLLEVKQWGAGAWTSMQNAFYGANNMHVTATDAPNLSGVTNMSQMFRDATSMNESINHWDTSTITNMSYLFYGDWYNGTGWTSASFNQPLDNWNTSAVTDMSYMFYRASAFNQPLNNWDTSKVTNINGMFENAHSFNQSLNSWNTGAVTSMSYTFFSARAFNQPLDNWDTSKVTSMNQMFRLARVFNQPLTMWNTAAVTDMAGMFDAAGAFNQPLGSWNVSLVSSMLEMFNGSGYTMATYDQTIDGWSGQLVRPNVSLGAYGVTYCNDAAHSTLTSAPNNWIITDGGFCPPTISAPAHLSVVSTATPIISGTAAANRTVTIVIDGTSITLVSGIDGTFMYEVPEALSEGWHVVAINSTDINGAPGKVSQASFYVHAGGALTLSGLAQTPTLNWSAAHNVAAGAVWSQATTGSVSFTERGSFGATSFNGKLWVVGGQGSSARLNDVWSSVDGTNWTRELENAPWGAVTPIRR